MSESTRASYWSQVRTLGQADDVVDAYKTTRVAMRLNPITLQPIISNPFEEVAYAPTSKRKRRCFPLCMISCCLCGNDDDSPTSSMDYRESSVQTYANVPQESTPSLRTIPEERENISVVLLESVSQRSSPLAEMVELTPRVVKNYLRAHPSVVKSVVEQEILLNMMEKMVDEKIYHSYGSTCTPQEIDEIKKRNFSHCMYRSKPEMLESIMQMVKCDCRREHILWEMCRCISIALRADGFRVLISRDIEVDTLTPYLAHKLDQTGPIPEWSEGVKYIYEEVFTKRLAVRLSRDVIHPVFGIIFPETGDFSHAMWCTVIEPDDQVAGVVEFWRASTKEAFKPEDETTYSSYVLWANVALQISQTFAHLLKQKHLNDFLMTVVKSIFQDMVSMKALVKKIINFAQRLVDADRASLFLVDHRNNELYATIFDSNVHDETSEELFNVVASSSKSDDGKQAQEEIRFPMGTGIAGYVALTGEVLNIKNAYEDARFNKAVDQRTGYRTETILCMPIKTRGAIIGVVQMINKCIGHFSPEDEEAFSVFSVYCGLALHHAKLYERITRSEQKYAIALEVLSYHSGCSDSEVSLFTNIDIKAPLDIDSYYFDAFRLDDTNKVTLTISMFKDMFGDMRCQQESLVRFVLTVRKNYRDLPYHNWTHGFSVANCMYSIIKTTAGVFTINERIALFISCLCHDLDHRGKNNKFMLETESPLAAMYSTSTMEHHHFNQTVIIIQQLAQKGHNIFKQLSSSEYKEMLSFVKHCILATDLARFFPNKAKLEDLVRNKQFSWEQKEHRFLIMAIAMTGCDLSASAKPWHIQVETVKVIFEEFYQQGDAERNAGRVPIPMMNRNLPDQQASCQVGFLTGICIPCYNLLNEILDATKPLMDMCQSNLMQWRKIEAEGKTLHCIQTEETSGEINRDAQEGRKDIAEIGFDESEDEMDDVNLTDDITVTPPNVEEEL